MKEHKIMKISLRQLQLKELEKSAGNTERIGKISDIDDIDDIDESGYCKYTTVVGHDAENFRIL